MREMMIKIEEEKLGAPDIKVAGLQIWIHGYQYSEAENEHDANWLRCSAHCGASGASVWVSGSILSTHDIRKLASESEQLYQKQITKLEVEPMEPELRLAVTATDSCGHLELKVEITPNHLSQEHSFLFEIDQSYLPPIEAQCRKVLDRFPYRQR
jgi:hypothetical protein